MEALTYGVNGRTDEDEDFLAGALVLVYANGLPYDRSIARVWARPQVEPPVLQLLMCDGFWLDVHERLCVGVDDAPFGDLMAAAHSALARWLTPEAARRLPLPGLRGLLYHAGRRVAPSRLARAVLALHSLADAPHAQALLTSFRHGDALAFTALAVADWDISQATRGLMGPPAPAVPNSVSWRIALGQDGWLRFSAFDALLLEDALQRGIGRFHLRGELCVALAIGVVHIPPIGWWPLAREWHSPSADVSPASSPSARSWSSSSPEIVLLG
jgi:hypothetical protein